MRALGGLKPPTDCILAIIPPIQTHPAILGQQYEFNTKKTECIFTFSGFFWVLNFRFKNPAHVTETTVIFPPRSLESHVNLLIGTQFVDLLSQKIGWSFCQ